MFVLFAPGPLLTAVAAFVLVVHLLLLPEVALWGRMVYSQNAPRRL